MKTFSEINNNIKEEMQLDPGLVVDNERIRYINDCLDIIGNLNILVKVTDEEVDADTDYLTVPDDFLKIRNLFWNGVRLAKLSNTLSNTSVGGSPIGFVQQGNTIRLYPIPTTAGTLKWDYNYSPIHVDSETMDESPDLPQNFIPLLVDYGCHRSHRKNGNYISSAQYKRDFDANLSTCVRNYISMLNNEVTIQSGEQNAPINPDTLIPPQ